MKLVSTLRKAAGPEIPLFPLCTTLLPDVIDFSNHQQPRSSEPEPPSSTSSNQPTPSPSPTTKPPPSSIVQYQPPYSSHSPSVGPLIIPEPYVYHGEPYLFPNILELMKAAKQIGMTVYVVTNGSTLNKDNIKESLEYVDKVSFSIDSPRGYINEKLGRGADSYTHVRDLLPYIRELYDEQRLLIDINSVVTLDPTHEYQELYYMLESITNELYRYNINKWKIIRFYPLRGKAIDNKDMNWLPDEDFIEIDRIYSNNHYVKVDVRNIKDMDDDFIVSPCGYLKKSFNGKEEILVDLKPALRDKKGSGRNV